MAYKKEKITYKTDIGVELDMVSIHSGILLKYKLLKQKWKFLVYICMLGMYTVDLQTSQFCLILKFLDSIALQPKALKASVQLACRFSKQKNLKNINTRSYICRKQAK